MKPKYNIRQSSLCATKILCEGYPNSETKMIDLNHRYTSWHYAIFWSGYQRDSGRTSATELIRFYVMIPHFKPSRIFLSVSVSACYLHLTSAGRRESDLINDGAWTKYFIIGSDSLTVLLLWWGPTDGFAPWWDPSCDNGYQKVQAIFGWLFSLHKT